MTTLSEPQRVLDENHHMPPEIEETLAELFCRFREKFGRDPGPHDPIFFDPNSDQPLPLGQEALNEVWERLANAMDCQGEITSETAYAMKKTGILVTDQTKDLLRDVELDEWNNALEEYRNVGQNGSTRPHDDLPSIRSVRPFQRKTIT